MLCQDCKQRVSTVIFTEVREGSKKVLHLCQACVEKRGISAPVLKNPLHVETMFKDMLHHLGEEESAFDAGYPPDTESCASCGWSFGNFRETGLLGCPECYTAFEDVLKSLMQRVHGSDEHLGKVYQVDETGLVREGDEHFLEEALEQAVRREEFEQAALIRDQLHQIRLGGD